MKKASQVQGGGSQSSNHGSNHGSDRGSILLIAVGILALFSVFAISFASLVSLEKKASQNYIDAVRARMVARAGFERAQAELKRITQFRPYDDIRGPAPGDPWIYPQRYLNAAAFVPFANTTQVSFPIVHPDFDVEVTNPQTGARTVQDFVYSGALGQTYNSAIDAYRLKVIDCASMINVNAGAPESVALMVKNLLRATFGMSDAQAQPIAQRLITMRPGAGYRTKAEIKNVLAGGGLTDDQWNQIRSDLTCYSWEDAKVIAPPNASSPPASDLLLTARAPLNMNTASTQALTAVFAQLSAQIKSTARSLTPPAGTNPAVVNYATTSQAVLVTFDEAQDLARRIALRRQGGGGTEDPNNLGSGPFKSWHEFETWLDSINWPSTAAGEARARKKDLIRAMANPNTALTTRKLGGEGNHIYRWRYEAPSYIPGLARVVDKSDLTAVTTELCFGSMGFFEITSLGQVWDAPRTERGQLILDTVVAEQTVQAVVQIFNVLRLTSQRDFERDREYLDPKLFLPYSNGIKGNINGFTTLASDLGHWPASLTQPEYSNLHNLPTSGLPPSQGADTYTLTPEYQPADYDGQVFLNGLARIQARESDSLIGFARGSLEPVKVRYYENDVRRWGAAAAAAAGRTADYDAGAVSASFSLKNPSVAPVRLTNDQVPAQRSLLNPEQANNDDLFRGAGLTSLGPLLTSDRGRFLAYDGNNLSLQVGTVHFWVKPVREVVTPDEQKAVYFSWLGGQNDTSNRDAGFEIYKVRRANKIYIETRFYGLNGSIGSEFNTTFTYDVGTIIGGRLTTDSLWQEGNWNHIQLSYGLDTGNLRNPQLTATMYINSQPQGATANQQIGNPSFVQHAYGGPIFTSIFFPPLIIGPGGVIAPAPKTSSGVTVYQATSAGQRGDRWFWPQQWYDYYYCDASKNTITKDFANEIARFVPNGDGTYTPPIDIPSPAFPANSYNKAVEVSYEPTPGLTGAPSPADNPPSAVPAISPSAPVTTFSYNPTGSDLTDHWTLVVTRRFKIDEVAKTAICADCRNCQDCSNAVDKVPTAYLNNNTDYHCFNRFPVTNGALTLHECDDCSGCEACDVDGPILIGAELYWPSATATGNPTQSSTTNADVDSPAVINFAEAIIDNIYMLGYRVDDNSAGSPVSPAVGVPSERFFDSDVAVINQSLAGAPGHKPAFKKQLLDLYGREFELGTLSWTGYPAFYREDNSGDSDPTTLIPVTVTLQRWDFEPNPNQPIDYLSNSIPGNVGFLDGLKSSNPDLGNFVPVLPSADPNDYFLNNPTDPDRGGEGLSLTQDDPDDPSPGPKRQVPTRVRPRELLILSVDFAIRRDVTKSLNQTPVLDDITLTYYTSPKIFYSEEGVDE